jgi:hypothetical protein
VAKQASNNPAHIEVLTEEESGRGWAYRVSVDRGFGEPREHAVTLSWADHEHWCGGRLPPSTVVRAVVRYLAEREDERPMPARFDAATARRWFPAIDRELLLRRAWDAGE